MILQRLSFWEFVIHQENLLELTYPPHTPPPLPTLTGATEHPSQVFKQQMGQGQRCEMVKSLVKTESCTSAPDHMIIYSMTSFSALVCNDSRQAGAGVGGRGVHVDGNRRPGLHDVHQHLPVSVIVLCFPPPSTTLSPKM